MSAQHDKIVGVLGGVFDPVHNGHLAIARSVIELLPDIDIYFVPCKIQVLKGAAHTSDQHRLAMLHLALQHLSQCYIDDRELTRATPSYMADTLADFRRQFPTVPLCLILGVDAFLTLPQWHAWERLFDYAHLMVINRPGFELPSTGILADLLKQRRCASTHLLTSQLHGNVYWHTMPEQPIASRDIRARIHAGGTIQGLVPENVLDYIRAHQLYTEDLT